MNNLNEQLNEIDYVHGQFIRRRRYNTHCFKHHSWFQPISEQQ